MPDDKGELEGPEVQPPEVGVVFDAVEHIECGACRCDMDVSQYTAFSEVQCPQCGKAQSVPGRLGPFLLLNLISTGGMGGVFHALDESLGRHVAIKVMLTSLGEDQQFVEDFRREAQAAARLNHPHVAQIYSFGEEKGQPYIVMELVSGKPFDKMIEESAGGVNQAVVMQIGLDIAEGLQAGDEIGLTHGDIKPENILLDEKMQAKLVDFGIAQLQGQKQMDGIWGTPYYIAPEKLKGGKTDARSDIYNLGATLYHALAGRPPFEGATPVAVVKARLGRPAPYLLTRRPDLDKTVADTIARMLEREPARRHPTYASLIADLRKALDTVMPKSGLGAGRGAAAGRRVVITKRPKTGVPTLAPPTVGRRRPTGSKIRPAAHTGAHPPAPRKKTKAPLIAFLVVVLFALAGGVLFLGYHFKQKRDARIEERRRVHLLKAEQERVTAAATEIFLAATNVYRLVLRVDPLVKQTREAAEVILGEALAGYTLSPRELPKIEWPTFEALAEQTPAGDVKADDGPDEGGAAEGSKPRAAEDAEAEKPADEEAEPAEGGGSEVTEPVAAEDGGTNAVAGPAADEPEIVSLLRDALTEALLVKTIGKAATKVAVDVAVVAEQAQAETYAASVAAKAGVLPAGAKALEMLTDEAEKAIERAAKIAVKAHGMKVSLLEQRAEQERLAQQQSRADAKRQLIAQEIERARGVEKKYRAQITGFLYAKSIRELRVEMAVYETPEGKKILRDLMDRYTYLVELKAFLVANLAKAPYPWGWIRDATTTVDVLGADDKYVKLKGRSVPWEEVSIPQYIRFVERYASDPTMKRGVRGKIYLGAAIFCYENGGEETALRYVTEALKVAPHLREEVERVLPFPVDEL